MSFITQICYNQQQSPLFPLSIIFFKDKNAILNPYKETNYNDDAANAEHFYRFWAAFTLWHSNDEKGMYHKLYGDISFVITSDPVGKWDFDTTRYRPLFGFFTTTTSPVSIDSINMRMIEYMIKKNKNQFIQQMY